VLSGRSGGGFRKSTRFRSIMVVAQVAASVVLLATAGALFQSFRRGRTMETGMDAERIAVTSIGIPQDDQTRSRALLELLRERLEDVDGITSVAFADRPPIGVGRSGVVVDIPGREPGPDQDGFVFDRTVVSWNYLDVAGLTLLRGRGFERLDDTGMPSAVLINRAAWDTWWPGTDPIGQNLVMDQRLHTILGIVENTRSVVQDQVHTPHVYTPIGGALPPRLTVVARLVGALTDPIQRDVRDHLGAILQEGTPAPLRTLDDALGLAVMPQRAASVAAGALGSLGLVLAALGLYGLMSFAVGQRCREFGIRLSLGERPRGLFLLVLRGGVRLLVVGITLGVVGALALFPVIQGLLSGVAIRDLSGAAWLIPIVVIAGTLAAGVPAFRAVRTDPVGELRT